MSGGAGQGDVEGHRLPGRQPRLVEDRHVAGHEGGLSAEYVAVLIVIGVIVAALWAADIQGDVKTCGETAVDEVFNMESEDDSSPC